MANKLTLAKHSKRPLSRCGSGGTSAGICRLGVRDIRVSENADCGTIYGLCEASW